MAILGQPCRSSIRDYVLRHRHASHVRATGALEVAGEIIAGVALPLAGYEGGFRYPAKDIWELKAQTSAGLLFITLGVICIADVIAKAFDK